MGFNIRKIFYFDTIKFVTVHSLKLGITHRSIQLIVVLYIFIYSVWLNKGYQEYSPVSGVLYTKAKGLGITNGTTTTVYDSSDLVFPPVENDAMFVTTSFISTPQQRRTCESTFNCTVDTDCKGQITSYGIIQPPCNNSTGKCLIEGWCPLEVDDSPHTNIYSVEDMTIFMRSSANYNLFSTIVSDSTDAIPGRNLYSLDHILKSAGTNISTCRDLGCIISVEIDWTCNLDKMDCIPKFSFRNSPGGFNYRKIDYSIDQTERFLQKLFGVRLLIKITGTGGRFSFFRMMITIGSGAAFFTLATVVTDFLLLFFFSRLQSFERQKWDHFHQQETEVAK